MNLQIPATLFPACARKKHVPCMPAEKTDIRSTFFLAIPRRIHIITLYAERRGRFPETEICEGCTVRKTVSNSFRRPNMADLLSSFAPYFILFPLVFLAGVVDAMAGGGGLISLPAFLIAGLPVHNAIATNKLSSSMGTSMATFRLARAGFIPWRQTMLCIAAALAGSSLGAHIALLVSDYIFKRLMLVILPVTAFYITRSKPFERTAPDLSRRQLLIRTALIAFFIGIYDGFYGPGTGTFLILLLSGLAGYSLYEANGMTKAINLTTNLAALAVFLINGKVLITLGLACGLCNIAGNYVGVTFFKNKGSRIVRPVMIGVLLLFFIKTLAEIFSA